MSLNFTFNNHEDARALQTIAEEKLNTLNKFIKESDSVVCDVEFDKVAANNKGNIFHAAVNLQINGDMYRADATEESFESAIDEVRDELDKRLRRSKSKKDSLGKRAGRALKRVLRR